MIRNISLRHALLATLLVGLLPACGRYRVPGSGGPSPDTRPSPDAVVRKDGGVVLKDASPADAMLADLGRDSGGSKLKITTASPLPAVTEGSSYKVQFAATGGTPPLGWLVRKGKIPAGLILQSNGLLSGKPTQIGDFAFMLKAVDDGVPPGVDQKIFSLKVKVAPLRITGGQVYNLFIVKVIVLPVMTIIKGVKLPYNTQLQALGGLKPYKWSKQKLPSLLRSLIPKSGLPAALTLDSSGKISGTVTDTKDVLNVTIPGTSLPLKGFLFAARVTDSQKKPSTADGVFLLPVIP